MRIYLSDANWKVQLRDDDSIIGSELMAEFEVNLAKVNSTADGEISFIDQNTKIIIEFSSK